MTFGGGNSDRTGKRERTEIEVLREEKAKLGAQFNMLRDFVHSIAVVEWIITDKDGEKCGYCLCDADEANGPIQCHEEYCLQIRARQILRKVAEAGNTP